ncbi:hypothetical protein MRX96_049629 [Rhipicephalus microplus]
MTFASTQGEANKKEKMHLPGHPLCQCRVEVEEPIRPAVVSAAASAETPLPRRPPTGARDVKFSDDRPPSIHRVR